MEYTAEKQQYQQQYQYQQAYEYDPSGYDRSAAYCVFANQQQQYQYYTPQDSYSQQYAHFYQETTPLHPPGVPLDYHNQPSVYYPPQLAVVSQQKEVIAVSGTDSATAAADFLGNMDMVQRDNPPPQMQTAYRGGRRGGRPFRGGSRGHVGNHGLRSDGSAPPHNRGHGHRGSRHFASNGERLAIPNSVLDSSSAGVVLPPSASIPVQATLSAQVPDAPLLPAPRMAWCELCRVDCNRPEILEQHKNGKRHKKNLRAHEELQKLNKVITGQQSLQVPYSGSEVVPLEKVEASEEKQHQQETLPSLAATNDNKKETDKQENIVNKSEASTTDPAEAKRKLKDPSEVWGRGFKHKTRGGRGGKYMKSNEGPGRPVEPSKPKGGIPFMCDLCNVKCESQVVFNSHLAGKKHVANLKRFHEHRALYGEAGLQALYPPNFNAPSLAFIPQIQQGLTEPQVVLAQLLTYVLSQAQVPGLAAPQISLPAATSAPAQTPLSSSENYYPYKFTQGSLATSEMKREVGTAEAETWQHSSAAKSEASPFAGNNKGESQTSESEKNEVSQQESFSAKFEFPPTAGTDVKVENGALDLENKVVIPPMDNPICATSEYLTIGGNPLLLSTSEIDTRTECKTVSLDLVDESGSYNNLEETKDDPEKDDLEDQNE